MSNYCLVFRYRFHVFVPYAAERYRNAAEIHDELTVSVNAYDVSFLPGERTCEYA